MLNKVIWFCKRHASKLLQGLIIILSVIVILLVLSFKSASATEVCFSEHDTERILLDLENIDILEQLIVHYEKLDRQYLIEIEELNDYLNECEQVLSKGSDLVLDYDKLIDKHEETAKKVEKQNKWEKFKAGFVSFISGAGVGIILAVLLI